MNVPSEFHDLFWDCRPETLDTDRHAPFILERLLEYGSLAAVRWALDTYGPERLKTFLRAGSPYPLAEDPQLLDAPARTGGRAVFRQILTEAQQTVLELLSRIAEIRTFYLAGGTALALHLGHRRSEDFDFFRAQELVPQDLLTVLRETGELVVLQEAAGTLTVRFRGVATSFFRSAA